MTRNTSVTGAASAARRYGAAVTAVGAAFALTRALWPWVDPHPTPLFLAAVMLSALYAGLGPSLVATALAALVVDYFFIPPTSGIELSVDNAVRTGIFVAAALFFTAVGLLFVSPGVPCSAGVCGRTRGTAAGRKRHCRMRRAGTPSNAWQGVTSLRPASRSSPSRSYSSPSGGA